MSQTEVIILSDSNESNSSTETHILPNKKKVNEDEKENSESSDVDFPEVQFDYASSRDIPVPHERFNKDTQVDIGNRSPRKYVEELDKSLNELLFNDQLTSNNDVLRGYSSQQSSSATRAYSGSRKNDEHKSKDVTKKDKAQLIAERLRKQDELARNKALKALSAKQLRDMKPGECLKFIEVTLDIGIRNLGLTADITDALQNSNIRYKMGTQLISNSITWKREIDKSYVDETNKICTVTAEEEVDRIIVIWNWEETVKKVDSQTLLSSICSIKDLAPKCIISLVVFGIEEYFLNKRKEKKVNKKDKEKLKNAPEISRKQLEMCLSEAQILSKCSCRLIDTPQELALMICQYSKSIAEIPFKIERNKNLKDKFDWYVTGDNRDTVRVDKDGNGLKRLWEQQLQQFNSSSLEVAQAISSLYPCPASLIEAYARSTENDGMNLLRDIPIRRAAGPLTAGRKIGNELSRKIYITFMSNDGDAVLR